MERQYNVASKAYPTLLEFDEDHGCTLQDLKEYVARNGSGLLAVVTREVTPWLVVTDDHGA